MSNKSRGKYFEDRIASILRDHLKLKKHQCHRYYESGMASGEYGDIYIQGIPLVIECKYYKNVSIENILSSKNSQYKTWLDQLLSDSVSYFQDYQLQPLSMLVCSRPNYQILSIIPRNSFHNNSWFSQEKSDKILKSIPSYSILTYLDSYLFIFNDLIKVISEKIKGDR